MAWFRRKPQAPQLQIGAGRRGIAAGSLKPGEQDLSAANIEKWKILPADVVKRFVYEGELLFVHSTNVRTLQYNFPTKQLIVTYKGGSSYVYDGVTELEAYQFATAQSKGGAVWDMLRVRGSKIAHKKPYRKV